MSPFTTRPARRVPRTRTAHPRPAGITTAVVAAVALYAMVMCPGLSMARGALMLVQLQPVPAMCRWAAGVRQAATVPPSLRAATVAAVNPLAPVVGQLQGGDVGPDAGTTRLRAGRYTYFAARTLEYDHYLWQDSPSEPFYYPLQQTDRLTWQAADGSTTGLMRRRWNVNTDDLDVGWYTASPRNPAVRDLVDPGRDWMGWSTDPAVLAVQLAEWDPQHPRPIYLLEVAAMRYRSILPTPAQHAAALTVLCTTPGIHYDGPVTDQVGRPGIGLSVDDDYHTPIGIEPKAGTGPFHHATVVLDPVTFRIQAFTITRPRHLPWPDDRSEVLLDAGYRTVFA